jgi:serine/threonine-protein kinase
MGRELPQGRRVGNYTVERLLSKSGLKAVYAARQANTDRVCILTVFHIDPDAAPWARFQREVEQIGQLRHPGLIEVLDLGISGAGLPYLVTESLAGETLQHRLRRSGALTVPQVLAVARQIGAALHAGHGIGVLHRGVRPDQIFIVSQDAAASSSQSPSPSPSIEDEEPPFERVKLLGYGEGHLWEETLSWLGLVGDPDYLAPEQILGHPLDVDPRADQYALAVVLYQSLTTSRPFHGDSVGNTLMQVVRGAPEPLRALRPSTPPHIDSGIARAMARDREARFADVFEFLQALQEGVPLPVGMAELTEPWLSPPPDVEEARRLVLASGGAPAAPLSIGVSAALLAAQSGPVRFPGLSQKEPEAEAAPAAPVSGTLPATGTGPRAVLARATAGGQAVPQVLSDPATLPYSMEAVMQLAVPPPGGAAPAPDAVPEGQVVDLSSSEIVTEPAEEIAAKQDPRAGETEVLARQGQSPGPGQARQLPSIIVDLPTRQIADGDRLPAHVAAPTDDTRVSALASVKAALPGALERISQQLDRRASLAERVGWALAGAGVGGLLMRLLS